MSDMKVYSGAMNGVNALGLALFDLQKQTNNAVGGTSYKAMLESLQAVQNKNEDGISVAKSTADMTMEEYKEHIWKRIDSYPFSPTRPYDEETIKISDKCWKRMKEDSAYEERMMNIIRDGRAYRDPFFGAGSSGTYWVLEFDGGEGCYSHAWSKNFGGNKAEAKKRFDREAEGGFWTKRAQKAQMQAEIDAKYHEQRKNLQRISEHRAMVHRMYARHQSMVYEDSEMPVMGVPAEFLLAGLGGNATLS